MSKSTFKGEIKVTEKYTDKEGNEKKLFHKIGALFEREDGSLCVQLVGGGWANVYPPEMKKEHYEEAKQAVSGGDADFDSEIPFAPYLDFIEG